MLVSIKMSLEWSVMHLAAASVALCNPIFARYPIFWCYAFLAHRKSQSLWRSYSKKVLGQEEARGVMIDDIGAMRLLWALVAPQGYMVVPPGPTLALWIPCGGPSSPCFLRA